MTTRSMLGDQPVKKSAPSYGFGAASRETAKKVFVSQEHTAKATAGTASPGPATYLLPPSVGGKQPDGRKQDPPTWGFGTAQRFRPRTAGPDGRAPKPDGRAGNNPGPGAYATPLASVGPQVLGRFRGEPIYGFGTAERKNVRKVWISQDHQKRDMHGMDSPGPAAPYQLKTTMGKQDTSTIESPPAWVFGSSARAKGDPGLASPGPAAYTLPQGVGSAVHPDSKKTRPSTPCFGTGTRDQRAKIYVGPGHDKGLHGSMSPGPFAGYQMPGSVGKQIHSKTADAPAPSFSKASRWASYEREVKKNSTPGPGAY